MSTALSLSYNFSHQGVAPDYVDPYTRGPLLLALSAVAIGIMYLFVVVRSYTKIYLLHKLTWDDLTCAIATLLSTIIFIVLILLERHGLGTHQRDVRQFTMLHDSYLKPLYLSLCIVPLIALFTKLSFYILFFQIFSIKPFMKWNIYITAVITTIFYLVITVILFVLMTPRPETSLFEALWNAFITKTSPALNTTFAMSYFNILSDLYIIILPISAVMRLNLRRRQKIGVIVVFMTALLAVAASSVSLYYRYQNNNSGDTTWNMMFVGYAAIVEHTIGVVCSCVPACFIALRRNFPLLVKFKTSLTSQSRRLTARFLVSIRSRVRRLFGLSGVEISSRNDQDVRMDSAGRGVLFPTSLPEVPQRAYQMLTARAFIWGGRSHESISVHEEGSGTSFSFV